MPFGNNPDNWMARPLRWMVRRIGDQRSSNRPRGRFVAAPHCAAKWGGRRAPVLGGVQQSVERRALAEDEATRAYPLATAACAMVHEVDFDPCREVDGCDGG